MNPFQFDSNGICYTKTEQKIIDYIYQNISSIPLLSIDELSNRLQISSATLSRFARHCGYQDYKELKKTIGEYAGLRTPADKMHTVLTNLDEFDISYLLRYQQTCIAHTIDNFPKGQAEEAVRAMIGAKTIYLHGKGASECLAALLQFRLTRFEKRVVGLPSGSSELFEFLVHAGPGDLAVVFGFQKISREVQVILDYGKKAGYQVILISSKLYDDTQLRGDINLYVYRGEPEEYHSMTAPIALIDALVVMMAQQLGDSAIDLLSNLYQLKETYKKDVPR